MQNFEHLALKKLCYCQYKVIGFGLVWLSLFGLALNCMMHVYYLNVVAFKPHSYIQFKDIWFGSVWLCLVWFGLECQ